MSKQLVEVTLAMARAEAQRAEAVSRHLLTLDVIGRMVDQLGELHGELAQDDRLQQVLGSLAFVWGCVEDELRAAAGLRRN